MKMLKDSEFNKLQRLVYDLSEMCCGRKTKDPEVKTQVSAFVTPANRSKFFVEDLQTAGKV